MEAGLVWAHLAAHHGVISRVEALDLELTAHQIKRRRSTGEWVEVQPQVFRHAAAPRSWLGDARAAALSVDSFVSHLSAARVWRLDGFNGRRLDVVVAEGRHVVRRHLSVHRSVNMDLCGETIRRGVPVTGISRTILDLAGQVGPRTLNRAVDSAFRTKLITWQMLYSVLVRHSARGRNGCGPLRLLLEERYGDKAIPDSNWNRDVGYLITDAGLPQPAFEYEVRDRGVFVARVDLAYPELQLAIECDSRRWHDNSVSFVRDPRRRNKLLAAGWRVLSFTWADYSEEPARLVDDVRQALAVARRHAG